MRGIILVLCLLVFSSNVYPQLEKEYSDKITAFNLQRNNLQKNAMLTLTGWSVLNLTSGTIGYFTTSGESRYFNQMNAGWNAVNLGLGLFGYFQSKNEYFDDYGLQESLEKHRSTSNAFLFNGALNLTYITSGFLLREMAKSNVENEMRFRGWGNSLILQGGFLLAFDLTSFVLHQRNRKSNIDPIIMNLSFKGNELGLVIKL